MKHSPFLIDARGGLAEPCDDTVRLCTAKASPINARSRTEPIAGRVTAATVSSRKADGARPAWRSERTNEDAGVAVDLLAVKLELQVRRHAGIEQVRVRGRASKKTSAARTRLT